MLKKTKENKIEEAARELNREILCFLNLSDIKIDTELTGGEKKDYLKNAELIYSNPVFTNEIKNFIAEQLIELGKNSEDFLQVMHARGAINGAGFLLERFGKLHDKYKNEIRQEE